MARKEKFITLDDGGNQLKFRVTQMSATTTKNWLIKLVFAVAPGMGFDDGVKVLDGMSIEGIIAAIGKSGDESRAKELLDGLLACCRHVTKSGAETQLVGDAVIDGIISDFRTLFKLYQEAGQITLDFTPTAPADESPSTSQGVVNMPKPGASGA